MTEELFYLRDSRSDVGSSAMFWSAAGGYTSDLSKAEKFTREKAVGQYNSRETDIPLRCDLVDCHGYIAVDCQLVDHEKMAAKRGLATVFQIPKRWDGNNIQFYKERGIGSFSYSEAFVAVDCSPIYNYIALNKDAIDKIARYVVCAELLDTRTFLRKAKIKMVKSRRARQTKGMTRHNCPCCGRILWSGNPYDAPLCNNFKCDRWRIGGGHEE